MLRKLNMAVRVGSSIYGAIKGQSQGMQNLFISSGARSYTVRAEGQDLLLHCLS